MKPIALIFSICLACHPTFSQSKEIETVISITKKAIYTAAVELKKKHNNLPKLKKVILTLEVATEKKANGELNIYVLSAGGDLSQKRTQKIDIELTPDFNGRLEIASDNSAAELKSLIIETSEGIANVSSGDTAMLVNKIEIEVGLTIEKTGKGGADINVGIVKFEGGVAKTKSNSNSVKLVFENE